MQGDRRSVAGAVDQGERFVDRQIGRIALGRSCQIDACLCQDDPGFRHTDLVNGIETGLGQQRSVRVCQSHIFRCQDQHPSGNEEGIFAASQHAGHPVDCAVGITATETLDEGRNDVVVLLAVFVIKGNILLQAISNNLIVNTYRCIRRKRLNNDLNDIEQLAAITATEAEKGFFFLHLNASLLQIGIFRQSAVQQSV